MAMIWDNFINEVEGRISLALPLIRIFSIVLPTYIWRFLLGILGIKVEFNRLLWVLFLLAQWGAEIIEIDYQGDIRLIRTVWGFLRMIKVYDVPMLLFTHTTPNSNVLAKYLADFLHLVAILKLGTVLYIFKPKKAFVKRVQHSVQDWFLYLTVVLVVWFWAGLGFKTENLTKVVKYHKLRHADSYSINTFKEGYIPGEDERKQLEVNDYKMINSAWNPRMNEIYDMLRSDSIYQQTRKQSYPVIHELNFYRLIQYQLDRFLVGGIVGSVILPSDRHKLHQIHIDNLDNTAILQDHERMIMSPRNDISPEQLIRYKNTLTQAMWFDLHTKDDDYIDYSMMLHEHILSRYILSWNTIDHDVSSSSRAQLRILELLRTLDLTSTFTYLNNSDWGRELVNTIVYYRSTGISCQTLMYDALVMVLSSIDRNKSRIRMEYHDSVTRYFIEISLVDESGEVTSILATPDNLTFIYRMLVWYSFEILVKSNVGERYHGYLPDKKFDTSSIEALQKALRRARNTFLQYYVFNLKDSPVEAVRKQFAQDITYLTATLCSKTDLDLKRELPYEYFNEVFVWPMRHFQVESGLSVLLSNQNPVKPFVSYVVSTSDDLVTDTEDKSRDSHSLSSDTVIWTYMLTMLMSYANLRFITPETFFKLNAIKRDTVIHDYRSQISWSNDGVKTDLGASSSTSIRTFSYGKIAATASQPDLYKLLFNDLTLVELLYLASGRQFGAIDSPTLQKRCSFGNYKSNISFISPVGADRRFTFSDLKSHITKSDLYNFRFDHSFYLSDEEVLDDCARFFHSNFGSELHINLMDHYSCQEYSQKPYFGMIMTALDRWWLSGLKWSSESESGRVTFQNIDFVIQQNLLYYQLGTDPSIDLLKIGIGELITLVVKRFNDMKGDETFFVRGVELSRGDVQLRVDHISSSHTWGGIAPHDDQLQVQPHLRRMISTSILAPEPGISVTDILIQSEDPQGVISLLLKDGYGWAKTSNMLEKVVKSHGTPRTVRVGFDIRDSDYFHRRVVINPTFDPSRERTYSW